MPDTKGFGVVLEATASVLVKALRGAWKSAECPVEPGDEGRIPEYLDVPPGTALGGFVVADGQVQIPQDALTAELAPDVDGARIGLGLQIQVEIDDPPVPSATLLDMAATVRAAVPIGTLPGRLDVGMLLAGLPRANVVATLDSGDPLAGRLDLLIAEYLHRAYENGAPGGPVDPGFPAIPHHQNGIDEVFDFFVGSYTLDWQLEIYDDPGDPAHRIAVDRPAPGTVRISLPVYLRMSNIRASGFAPALADPMGIETRLVVTAALESPPGSYVLRLDTADVAADPLVPAAGVEGANYAANAAALPPLPAAIQGMLGRRGRDLVRALGSQAIAVPTVADIETTIGDLFHAELVTRGYVAVWTPEAAGEEFSVDDVTTRVHPTVLAIGLNAGAGADIAALDAFVPVDRDFAIALDGAAVREMIDRARAENGFADSDLPKRMRQDGKDVDLRELDVFLVDGAIRMTGAVTVVDAILGSVDVDADFRADVGLLWNPDAALNADGVQALDHQVIGDPDVDPEGSVAFWIIAIILAVISWGAGSILIAIVIVVVALIVTAIAESIGSSLAVDGVTGAVSGITAWPPQLSRIGGVTAVFHNPVVIEADGLLLAGTIDVISSCEATQVVPADSGSTYAVVAAAPLQLTARNTADVATYRWLPGDGSPAVADRDVTHTYAASGLYIAKHALRVTEPGGALSRHFAAVAVANVAPVVDAGPDIEVDEGEVVTLVGTFTDVEYPDTHESTWNFGDTQPTEPGVVDETNEPPQARGTSTVQHAWCDNGTYTVTLRVRDQNGGMGVDRRVVRVRNVAPTVDAGPDMFAYPCTVLTLTGAFTDPGWCDTHTAMWDFGDCSPLRPATVEETHLPPAGRGTAVASHVYRSCGVYHVVCTVTDDDGGTGADALVVRVTDVANRRFEDGYSSRRVGQVANEWTPYVIGDGAAGFFAEQFVVRAGRRSQGVRVLAGGHAGLWQQVGANPGWAYEVAIRFSVDEPDAPVVRLGLDPDGGTDRGAPRVVWSTAGTPETPWGALAVRAEATGSAVTIFLDVAGTERDEERAWFDEVEMLAIQPYCPVEEPAEPPRCVDFRRDEPGAELPPEHIRDGFTIRSLDQSPMRVARMPGGTQALVLGSGVLVDLPFPADVARLVVWNLGGEPVRIRASDDGGRPVARETVQPRHEAEVVELRAARMVRVQLTSRGAEGALEEICARRKGDGRG